MLIKTLAKIVAMKKEVAGCATSFIFRKDDYKLIGKMEWRRHKIKIIILNHLNIHLEGFVGFDNDFFFDYFFVTEFFKNEFISAGFKVIKRVITIFISSNCFFFFGK